MSKSKREYDYLLKYLVIGDGGVGKTTLLTQFCREAYDAADYPVKQTVGIDFQVKLIKIGSKRIKLQIWDTAGQERYRSITNAYYRGAHGILVVYDVTDNSSFKHVKSWMANIGVHADNTVVTMLVGNKIDRVSDRIIKTAQGQQLADEYKIKFFEVSAKDRTNIESPFEALSADITAVTDPIQSDGEEDIFKKESESLSKICCS